MPSSLIHLCIAEKVINKIPVNKDEFFYGNILPDYLAVKDYKKKAKLHFYEKIIVNDITKDNVNIQSFLNTYKDELKDSVSLGIYSHFIADNMWIENFIKLHLIKQDEKIYIKTKRGLIRNNRITVYNDYDRMANWIVNKYNLSKDFIKDVNYNGFFSNIYDLPKDDIYNKMDEYMSKVRLEEMEVFTKEEIDEFINKASIEVEKRLRQIEIKE